MVDPKDPKLSSHTAERAMPLPPPRPTLNKPQTEPEDMDSSDEDVAHPSPLERSFKAMSIQTGPPRFLGKSSRFFFFKKAYELKYEAAGLEPPNLRDRDLVIPWKKNCSELWVSQPVSHSVALYWGRVSLRPLVDHSYSTDTRLSPVPIPLPRPLEIAR